jgi:hypothetical protein
VARCAADGELLSGGVVCVDRTARTWVTTFLDTGTVTVRAAALGDAAPAGLMTVDLGPRTEHLSGASPLVGFVPAPGAVFVYTVEDAAPGSRNVVVGLR